MGAVLKTNNRRLSPDQLAFIITDAEAAVIVPNQSPLPLLDRVRDRIPSVRHIVVMAEWGTDNPASSPADATRMPAQHDYETLLAGESGLTWPDLPETTAAAMGYTSGTTGNPNAVVPLH